MLWNIKSEQIQGDFTLSALLFFLIGSNTYPEALTQVVPKHLTGLHFIRKQGALLRVITTSTSKVGVKEIEMLLDMAY